MIFAAIVEGPLTPDSEANALRKAPSPLAALTRNGSIGASLRFEGIVRRLENDRELIALKYETYDAMAQRELESLARAITEQHGLLAIVALHSKGRVPVGEVSFVLTVVSAHRAEAIAATTDFIDRLKREVPIWKMPVWVDEQA